MTGARTANALGLPSLGFGSAPIGNLFQAMTDEDAALTVEAAWDAGIRYFDTAPHYGLGLSERRLGEALRAHPRSEYVVSTKVGRLLVPARTVTGRDDELFDVAATHHRVRDYSADGVRRSLEASLERLGLDRIDIVLIHDPDDHTNEAIEQAAPALSALRAEGTIRSYGAGMNQSAPLTRFVRETDADVVMVAGRYSLLDQTAARDLLPEALRRGVGVINAGVFGSGLLALPQPRLDATYDYRPASAAVVERARNLARVCHQFGVDLPTVALAFAANHPAIASVVVGLRSRDEVADAVRRRAQPVAEGIWAAMRQQDLIDDCLDDAREHDPRRHDDKRRGVPARGDVDVREVEPVDPDRGDLQVRVEYCGLCGTYHGAAGEGMGNGRLGSERAQGSNFSQARTSACREEPG